jgi:type VI secretion system ImpC/EvpB family protein
MNGTPAITKVESLPGRPPAAAGELLPFGRLLDEGGEPSLAASLREFLAETDLGRALSLWLDQWRDGAWPESGTELIWMLERDIARIDDHLGQQLDVVLHHAAFQGLEASWRGLQDLVLQIQEGANVKVRVLSATKTELARDLERAIEFDQSALFRKVYSDEFDMPGGEPYSVLVGDYEFTGHPDDIDMLSSISNVAAAAFAPCVVGAHPFLFGLDDFGELDRPMDLQRHFDQLTYLQWRRLRETEDARFLALTVPRVLRREPHEFGATSLCDFPYLEDVSGPSSGLYLWGPAVYAYAGVLIQAFQRHGWLEDIRGAERDRPGGGLVTGLPAPAFRCDPGRVAPRGSTDLNIDEELDRELRDLGFLPLCHCQGTSFSAFHGTETLQRQAVYDREIATANAWLSAQIPVILNVSRFAHYLKVIARNRIGTFLEPRDLELILQRWLTRYVSANEETDTDPVPRHPLREAHVMVRERPEKPGSYVCVIHLRPRLQQDSMTAALRLTTELADHWNLQAVG